MSNGFFQQSLQKSSIREEVNIAIKFYMFDLGIKFELKLTILNFWTNSTKKEISKIKKKEIKITIEFYIFELV